MTLQASAAKLSHLAHGESTGPDDIDLGFRQKTIEVLIPADANAADATDYILFEAQDHAIELRSASICAAAQVAQDAANYAILDLSKEDGAAGGLTSLDLTNTQTGSGGTLAARVPRDFTIVPSTDTLALGEILVLHVTKAGAGVVVTDLLFRATYRITD